MTAIKKTAIKNQCIDIDKLSAIVEQIPQDDIYEIYDHFTTDEVTDIVYNLLKYNEANINGYMFKMNNNRQSFISCSGDEGTGVSESVFYIYDKNYHSFEEGVKNIVEMASEALYLCNEG